MIHFSLKYWYRAGKCIFPALFLITLTPLQAQKEPPQRILNLLGNLDRVSDEGNWDLMDSSYRSFVGSAIAVSRKEFLLTQDSILKSVLLYHSGRLEILRRNYDTAFADLKNALHYDISNIQAMRKLCGLSSGVFPRFDEMWTYVNAGIEQWKTKCMLDSTNPFNWYQLGQSYDLQKECLNIRNDDKTVAAYRKCMELDSGNVLYVYLYAMATPEKERLSWLKKALEMEENVQIRLAVMDTYRSLKDEHELLNFLNRSAAIYETSYPGETVFLEKVWREMSGIYQKKNDRERYELCLEKAAYYKGLQSR